MTRYKMGNKRRVLTTLLNFYGISGFQYFFMAESNWKMYGLLTEERIRGSFFVNKRLRKKHLGTRVVVIKDKVTRIQFNISHFVNSI